MQKIDLNLQSNQNNSGDINQTQSPTTQPSPRSSAPARETAVDESLKISENHNPQHIELNELDLESDSALMKKKNKTILAIISLVAIVAGSATGVGSYKLFNSNASTTNKAPTEDIEQVAADQIKAGDIFGVQDEETFKDSAQGYLDAGGLDGEGSHKLLRAGGESQTVYLTSSVTDLDKMVGMEVKIWGETYKGQKAGWLMDVGKVEVINPEAEPPVGETMD